MPKPSWNCHLSRCISILLVKVRCACRFVHVHAQVCACTCTFQFHHFREIFGVLYFFSHVRIKTCRNNLFTIGISVTHHKTSPPLPTTTMIKTHWYFCYTKCHPLKSILVQFWWGKYQNPCIDYDECNLQLQFTVPIEIPSHLHAHFSH